jgi:hypothetical protein
MTQKTKVRAKIRLRNNFLSRKHKFQLWIQRSYYCQTKIEHFASLQVGGRTLSQLFINQNQSRKNASFRNDSLFTDTSQNSLFRQLTFSFLWIRCSVSILQKLLIFSSFVGFGSVSLNLWLDTAEITRTHFLFFVQLSLVSLTLRLNTTEITHFFFEFGQKMPSVPQKLHIPSFLWHSVQFHSVCVQNSFPLFVGFRPCFTQFEPWYCRNFWTRCKMSNKLLEKVAERFWIRNAFLEKLSDSNIKISVLENHKRYKHPTKLTSSTPRK